MQQALAQAQLALAAGEVPVGAVVVRGGQVIARGHNTCIAGHDPSGHAEIVALRAAAQVLGNYRLDDCELYVTLEPCAMCAGAISHARIERLIFAAEDAKGGAILHGPRFFEQPTCHWRPQIQAGVLAQGSAELLRAFFKARRG